MSGSSGESLYKWAKENNYQTTENKNISIFLNIKI